MDPTKFEIIKTWLYIVIGLFCIFGVFIYVVIVRILIDWFAHRDDDEYWKK